MNGQASLTFELSLSQLESHLWEAANILRGSPVDRADWKSYILPLLFFKRICDGTGGMLLACVEHVRARGGDPRTFFGRLFGQEKNLTTSSVARMNLLLHGVEDFQIERGDTLRNPIFTDPATGGLATFDIVLANPPFSLERWGREVWEADPWGRAFAGVPTDSSGDFAWVQHMVKSMAPRTGSMAVVLP